MSTTAVQSSEAPARQRDGFAITAFLLSLLLVFPLQADMLPPPCAVADSSWQLSSRLHVSLWRSHLSCFHADDGDESHRGGAVGAT